MQKITVLIFTLLLGLVLFLSTGLAQTQQNAGTPKSLYLAGGVIVSVNLNGTNPQLIIDGDGDTWFFEEFGGDTWSFAVDAASRKIYYRGYDSGPAI